MLTVERLRKFLDYNPATGVFRWKVQRRGRGAKVGKIAGTPHIAGYISIGIERKRYLSHRLAWLWFYGEWPSETIDHIDGNRQNNAIKNLRLASLEQNAANSIARQNKSGVRFVTIHKPSGRYRVQLHIDGRQTHIGYFSSLEEAERAARERSAVVHGDFSPHHRYAHHHHRKTARG